MIELIAVLLVLSIVVPFGAYFISKKNGKKLLVTNIVSFFAILLVATVFIFSGSISADETTQAGEVIGAPDGNNGMLYLAAALSTGLATIGAGIAVAASASAALGAISENDKIMGKALIFVALAEGIALYGLLVSFTILGKLG